MTTNVTSCCVCLKSSDDLKSLVHSKYVNLDLCGFYMKRAIWKCKECIISAFFGLQDAKGCAAPRNRVLSARDLLNQVNALEIVSILLQLSGAKDMKVTKCELLVENE